MYSKPYWFIEEGMSLLFKKDRFNEFLSILKQENCTVGIKHRNSWDSLFDFKSLDMYTPTILYCSIDVGKHYHERSKVVDLPWPGVWFDPELLRCSSYFVEIGSYLLNKDYGIYTFKTIKDNPVGVFENHTVKTTDKIFIRPEKNEKNGLFVGQALNKNEFKDWLIYNEEYVDPDALCVISSGKKIDREWRLIIDQNRKVISGSLYKTNGELTYQGGYPEEVVKFAEEVASVWSPHPVWCLDIGESEGQLGVVELSTVNCSGWYDSELKPIVKAINDAMLRPIRNEKLLDLAREAVKHKDEEDEKISKMTQEERYKHISDWATKLASDVSKFND